MADKRKLPLTAFRFQVEIGGLTVAGFSEVSGLQVETEVVDYRAGGENSYVYRLPGPSKYPSNLVLKRGMADADELWSWHQEVVSGNVNRKQCTVHLMDLDGSKTVSWTFEKAYPVKWVGPELRGDSNTIAVQSVELAHHGFSVERNNG